MLNLNKHTKTKSEPKPTANLRTVRTCVHIIVRNYHAIQQRTFLIIFPNNLQTIIIAQLPSIGGEGIRFVRLVELWKLMFKWRWRPDWPFNNYVTHFSTFSTPSPLSHTVTSVTCLRTPQKLCHSSTTPPATSCKFNVKFNYRQVASRQTKAMSDVRNRWTRELAVLSAMQSQSAHQRIVNVCVQMGVFFTNFNSFENRSFGQLLTRCVT